MTITIMYEDTNIDYLNTNLGEILNMLSLDGWILDRDIVIPRHPLFSFFTRHKLHLIMKKEYEVGEDPFRLFRPSNQHCNEDHNSKLLSNTPSTNNEDNCNPSDNIQFEEGDSIEYNGVPSIIIKISDKVTLVSINGKNGTWNEAIEYCNNLGAKWNLPTIEEIRAIKSRLKDNVYWTIHETSVKRAANFDTQYDYTKTVLKDNVHYIQPIAIVDISELE